MKNHTEIIVDSFTDFQGKEHHFTIAAISIPINEYYVSEIDEDCDIYAAKGLKIGISICNPEDEYDRELGITKAIGRAKNAEEFALIVSKPGYINTNLVQAFLRQEAQYLKNNPGQYIAGYKDAENRYFQDLEMKKYATTLSEVDSDLAYVLAKDVHYLDDLYEYAAWLRKQLNED